MKVSKPFLSAILVVIIACVLVGAAIMLLRSAIVVRDDWNGVHPFQTSTPTLTLFPEQGWWTSMPTAPGLGVLPTPSVTSTSSTKMAPTRQPSSTPIHQP
jgi:hypothetical protein